MLQDVLDVVEEEDKSESESSSEYEEYTDSEDETGPRLKPVFVPKTDRLSLKEKEAQAKKEAALEQERKRQRELRKKESHRVSHTTLQLLRNSHHWGMKLWPLWRVLLGCPSS